MSRIPPPFPFPRKWDTVGRIQRMTGNREWLVPSHGFLSRLSLNATELSNARASSNAPIDESYENSSTSSNHRCTSGASLTSRNNKIVYSKQALLDLRPWYKPENNDGYNDAATIHAEIVKRNESDSIRRYTKEELLHIRYEGTVKEDDGDQKFQAQEEAGFYIDFSAENTGHLCAHHSHDEHDRYSSTDFFSGETFLDTEIDREEETGEYYEVLQLNEEWVQHLSETAQRMARTIPEHNYCNNNSKRNNAASRKKRKRMKQSDTSNSLSN